MTASTDSDPASRSHRPDRRQTIENLLEHTDQSLKRGARPGAQVWPTGFDLLDSTLDGGLRSGELVLLGGNEGSGKTTMAVQMVRNAVAAGRHGVVFSFEHHRPRASCSACSPSRRPPPRSRPGSIPPPPPTCTRCASVFEAEDPDRRGLAEALARVPYGFDALEAVQQYAGRLQLHESGKETTPDEIARVVTAITEEVGEPPIVLIDYLQKMPLRGHRGDEASRVTIVTEMLKDMSLELGCPIVCISAADRESLGAGPPDAHPRPAWLLGAGLRGRPGADPVEQGEHRLARAPGLRPRQHQAVPRAGRSSPSRRTAAARARSSSRCRRTSSTAASTPRPRWSPSASSRSASSPPDACWHITVVDH